MTHILFLASGEDENFKFSIEQSRKNCLQYYVKPECRPGVWHNRVCRKKEIDNQIISCSRSDPSVLQKILYEK